MEAFEKMNSIIAVSIATIIISYITVFASLFIKDKDLRNYIRFFSILLGVNGILAILIDIYKLLEKIK